MQTLYTLLVWSTTESFKRTAIWLAETLAGAKFVINEAEDGCVMVQCTGIGFRPSDPEMNLQAVPTEP